MAISAWSQSQLSQLSPELRAYRPDSPHDATQLTTVSPSTRSNSQVLWVTRVAFSAKAWHAIQRSCPPIGVPADLSRVNWAA
jgi:hypothetical protein